MLRLKMQLIVIVFILVLAFPTLTIPSTNNTHTLIEDFASETPEHEMEFMTNETLENLQIDHKAQRFISLDGTTIESMPSFVLDEDRSQGSGKSQTRFITTAIDQSKPNITSFAYQNLSSVQEDYVTWMKPNDTVRLWFKVKGPLSPSGPEVHLRFDGIVDQSMDWAYSPILDAQINNLVDITQNESVWFYAEVLLPMDTGSNYGWGNGLINAFAPSLYQPYILFVQDFEEFYGGLYDKSSYLHMFGEIHIKKVNWYNYTYDAASPEYIRCTVAERNWAVFAEFEFWVSNAPVWDISFKTYYHREIVFWPDESILVSDDNLLSRLDPGLHKYRPERTGSWVGWLLEEDWAYGSLIGQTRCLYSTLLLLSGGQWGEIYNSKEEGEVLFLVDNIQEQPPQVDILSPMEGEVISQSIATLRAMISDPNANQQITDVIVYIDGAGESAYDLYNPITGLFEYNIDLQQKLGKVNITILAIDGTGLRSNSTVLVIVDNPLSYFPASYTSEYIHYVKTLSNQKFEWEYPLNFNTGTDLNISLIPRVEFGFNLSISLDIYHSKPTLTFAGEEFTSYVSVSDPSIDLRIWFKVGVEYDIYLQTSHMVGDVYLIDEQWDSSQTIPLGIEILDLRYDIPELSNFIRRYTHFQRDFLDYFPILGEFADLELIIDIIPLLKISNLLTADVIGTNCVPEKDSLQFVSDKMFALTGVVDSAASGNRADIILSNVALESIVGLDLRVNFTLNGGILGYSLVNIDINQWLFDNLGIVVPYLSLWSPKVTSPIAQEIALGVDVAEQQLDIEMIQISADKDLINVTILVEDELYNGVSSASVTASSDTLSYTVSESGNGRYMIEIPYRTDKFDLEVSVSKSGYIGTTEIYTLYIDPVTVDSTPPSIEGVTISPEMPKSSDEVTVRASIIDDLTYIVAPRMHYSLDDGHSWTVVNMSLVSGTTFEAKIPVTSENTKVLLFISVSDAAGNQISSAQYSYTVSGTGTTTTDTTSTDTMSRSGETVTSDSTYQPDNGMLGTMVIGVAVGLSFVVLLVILWKRNR